MSSSVPDYMRRSLEQLKQARIEDYDAANRQLVSAVESVEQTRIKRLLSDLDREIQEIDKKLALDQIPEEVQECVPVRVFFILSPFCTDEMVKLLLRQNRHQPFFDIGIATSWNYWTGRPGSESTLQSFDTDACLKLPDRRARLRCLLDFCDSFREEMNRYNQDQHEPFPPGGINLAITELPVPLNYYTWNTRDRKGVVIGIRALQSLFENDPDMVRKIVVRVAQRMLLYSLQIPGLQTHEVTKSCLFDFTEKITDIQFSVNDPGLCQPCKASIRDNKGKLFFEAVNAWLQNSFLSVTT